MRKNILLLGCAIVIICGSVVAKADQPPMHRRNMPASKTAADRAMNQAMMDMMKANAAIKLTGEQDRDFMLMMIAHHQAAIDMARVQLAHGKHPQLRALARSIISAQQREIQEMRGWLHKWYGE